MKSDDIRILRDIEQYYATQIDEMPMNGKVVFCSKIFLLEFFYANLVLMFSSQRTKMFFFISVADLI